MSIRESPAPPFGTLMRQWRTRRRLSQLDLAIDADISARHLSFLETGRSVPSRAMVLRLTAVLDIPRREQNQLLVAAGLAPVYTERSLDDPEMTAIAGAVQRVLTAYQPYPCLAVDRRWTIVATNTAATALLDGVSPALLATPNALRIALHPDGLAPRIRNLAQWRHHLLQRLRRETAVSGDPELGALLTELEGYPGDGPADDEDAGVVVPLELQTSSGDVLTLLSTVTTFGTALDLTAAELSLEAFLPADDATARALR